MLGGWQAPNSSQKGAGGREEGVQGGPGRHVWRSSAGLRWEEVPTALGGSQRLLWTKDQWPLEEQLRTLEQRGPHPRLAQPGPAPKVVLAPAAAPAWDPEGKLGLEARPGPSSLPGTSDPVQPPHGEVQLCVPTLGTGRSRKY